MKNKIKKLASQNKLRVNFNDVPNTISIKIDNTANDLLYDDKVSLSDFLFKTLEIEPLENHSSIDFNLREKDFKKLIAMDKNITLSLLDSNRENKEIKLSNESRIISGKRPVITQEYPDEYVHNHREEDYIVLKKDVHCPKCGHDFTQLYPKCTRECTSLLSVNPFDKNYYSIPVYYSIWVCPKCTYSNFYYDFENLNTEEKQNLKEVVKGFSERFSYKEPRDYEQLLKAHYHAIDWALSYSSSNYRLGKLWLNMMCIYNFSDNFNMLDFSSSQALKYFYNVLNYESAITNFTPVNQLYLVIAEILFTKNNFDSSFNYFINALNYTEDYNEQLQIKKRINNLFNKNFRV